MIKRIEKYCNTIYTLYMFMRKNTDDQKGFLKNLVRKQKMKSTSA